MGLQREIWLASIVEGLFASNVFATRSVDHSEFVNGKTVHVPNAGAASSVEKNRTKFPATVGGRTDVDLSYNIDEFTTDPLRIPHADTVELSYSKRESVIRTDRAKLLDSIYADIIYKWIPTESPFKQATLGAAVEAHVASATGNRKAMDKATVKAIKKIFDRWDVPQEGRCMLLDSDMYNQLLDDLTDAQTMNFLAGANPETGVIGRYMGFDFYMRSQVAKATSAGVIKDWATQGAATDCAAGIAWQEGCVSRAAGDAEMFEDEKSASYYADVVSFLQRAGGKHIRNDKKGVVLIYQDTPA